jgi:hypothetical protein
MGCVLTNVVDFGLSGLQVDLGDHICGFYAGPQQRDDVLIPFLQAGLRAGDKCICVVDGSDPSDVVAAVGGTGGGASYVATHQLDVMRASDMYLRSGAFSAAEVIDSWKAAMSEVMYGGRFDAVRAIETWSLRDVVPDRQELLALEAAMNRYLPLYPQVIVCMYDLERFGGGVVVDLLKTHPRMLLSGMVVENPYFAAAAGDAPDSVEDERQEAAAWCYAVTTGST